MAKVTTMSGIAATRTMQSIRVANVLCTKEKTALRSGLLFFVSNDFLEQRLGIQVVALYVFEVLERTDFELLASSLVANDDTVGVELQGADGPPLCDRAFDGSL